MKIQLNCHVSLAFTPLRLLVLFSGDGATIHLSPTGQDEPGCGKSAFKCKTIDYVLDKNTQNNRTLILESSTTEILVYHLNKSFENRGRNDQFSLRLIKDNKHGINPKINGLLQRPFIDGVFKERRISIVIDSIDLYQVFLIQLRKR